MHTLVSYPIWDGCFEAYNGADGFVRAVKSWGAEGIEAIWGGETPADSIPAGLVGGYHLMFYADWLDFWLGDETALVKKFGSRRAYTSFYSGTGRFALLTQFRKDLERAAGLGVPYVVYHVSDVSIEEGYTYRWLHGDEQVIDAAAELINTAMYGRSWPFTLLVENQWWPGFKFTEPKLTERLLEALNCEKKGIMLDTGHLMNTNIGLRSQAEGAQYIVSMLKKHGELSKYVKGLHLHQSLSGGYVSSHTGKLPGDLPYDYLERFSGVYPHVQSIDTHKPWTDEAVKLVVDTTQPEYLTNELAFTDPASLEAAVRTQLATLGY